MIQTITEKQAATELTLLPMQEDTYLSKMQALEKILNKNQENKDYLSRHLFKWGVEFLHFLDKPQEPEKEPLMERIHRLKAILQEPFSGVLLQDPWLLPAADLTWEKKVLDHYLGCQEKYNPQFSKSSVEAIPHIFAKQMLELLHSVDPQPLILKLVPQLPQVNAIGLPLVPINSEIGQLMQYEERLRLVFKERKQLETIAKFQKLAQILEEELEEGNKRNAEKMQQVTHHFEKQTNEVKEKLGEIRQEYKKDLAAVQKVQKETEEKLKDVVKRNVEAHNELSQQKSTISSLYSQLNYAQSQLSWMHNKRDSGCAIL